MKEYLPYRLSIIAEDDQKPNWNVKLAPHVDTPHIAALKPSAARRPREPTSRVTTSFAVLYSAFACAISDHPAFTHRSLFCPHPLLPTYISHSHPPRLPSMSTPAGLLGRPNSDSDTPTPAPAPAPAPASTTPEPLAQSQTSIAPSEGEEMSYAAAARKGPEQSDDEKYVSLYPHYPFTGTIASPDRALTPRPC